ncbi:MAG: peptide chain release factor 2 [Chloroflexaceae bacterium]|nr:peptide chain release factor 2 [Chloroflexaceae bacterium]
MQDLKDTLQQLREAAIAIRGHLDLPSKQQQIEQLETRAADPNLWNDQREAQRLMQKLTQLKQEVEQWDSLDQQLTNLEELIELAEAEDDQSVRDDIAAELEQAQRELRQRELSMMLNGPYDDRDAFLSIQAGTGGTDAQDWAAMLMRMYTRWAESRNYKVSIVDESPGDEAGIKSATLELRGHNVYGYVRSEAGVHRLIRLSPFNSAHARQTSFARVEIMPEVDDAPEVEINTDDLRIDVFRSAGHGGQGVNTTDSAVRLTHLPSGIVVTCQNERSQLQNKETAIRVLRGRLLERELQRQQEERLKLRGEYRQADFGNQMRTYYLHPYTLVKDHRTDEETSDVRAVLDGSLDPFIESYLRWHMVQVS